MKHIPGNKNNFALGTWSIFRYFAVVAIGLVVISIMAACFADMFESSDNDNGVDDGDESEENEWVPPEGITKSKTIGMSGGSITVENTKGDKVTLEVPEFSLLPDTNISVTVYDNPTSPHTYIEKTIFPGVFIEPSNTVLRDFVRLTVELADTVNPDEVNMLFKNPVELSGEESNYIVPVGITETAKTDDLSDNTLEANLYQLGLFFGGAPTKSDLEKMVTDTNNEFRALYKIQSRGPYGWQTTMTAAHGAIKIADAALVLGYDGVADNALETATRIAEDAAEDMLDAEPPSPCDEDYVVAMARHHQLLDLLGNPNSETFDNFGDAFEQMMDECMNRCRLYFSYTGTTAYADDGEETISYEGPVVITSPFGGEDYGYPVSGEGEFSLTGSGAFNDCTTTITGVMKVGVKGKIELEDNYQDLSLIIDVTCNSSGTKLFECEDGSFSMDLPLYQEFHFEIPFEDGHSVGKDLAAPGYSGTITVVLYIEKFTG